METHSFSRVSTKFRSSHQRCSVRRGVLRNFTKFTVKHLPEFLFKNETLAQVFSCEFSEISKNTFSTERLWTTASENFDARKFCAVHNIIFTDRSHWITLQVENYLVAEFAWLSVKKMKNLLTKSLPHWPSSSVAKFQKCSQKVRSNCPELFLRKGILKICSKFTWENLCRSVISIKLQSNFIEITLRHGCSPVN